LVQISSDAGRERLFAAMVQAELAEFNAINAAARAARERGDSASLWNADRGMWNAERSQIHGMIAAAGAVAQLGRLRISASLLARPTMMRFRN
jgi:hypothetical protein